MRTLWELRPGSWVPAADGDSRSALHAAVHWNQPAAVQFLLRELPALFILEHMHPQYRLDRWDNSAEVDASGNVEIEEKLQAWMYRCHLSVPA